ncbi:unnamed protein product [Linum trigynum]|uniref:Uncharacterized protein n=1 Tax=Linum trigynum TaxID=586398 RepID=A0AAV2CEN7_9ROSI
MSKPIAVEGEDRSASHQAEETVRLGDASLAKEDLIQIIENHDQVLEILKKEIVALKEGGDTQPTPGSKRRERDEEGEGVPSFVRRREELGHLTRHPASDFDEQMDGHKGAWEGVGAFCSPWPGTSSPRKLSRQRDDYR